eukprot:gb/GECG01002345.1/.p1 GENE.gb/GECG01002345.1/~~gb/GECG01002345.1/.p1  ORF type:complete len:192 (+),score=39.48 gb/GECG01002345.1/:1-576(+)
MGGKKRMRGPPADSTQEVDDKKSSLATSSATDASAKPLISSAVDSMATSNGTANVKIKKKKRRKKKSENGDQSQSQHDTQIGHKSEANPSAASLSIDDIFDGVKRAKKASEEKERTAKKHKEKTQNDEQLQRRIEELEKHGRAANRGGNTHDPKPVRFDSELGMNIYSEESLRINKGGGTSLCPFDCSCCY